MGSRGISFVVAALLLCTAPFVVAQSDGEVRLTDGSADVRVDLQAGGVAPAGGFEDIDLEEAWLGKETPDAISMGFRLMDWETPTRNPREIYSSPDYELHFRFKDSAYRFVYWDYSPCDGTGARYETRHVSAPAWNYVACIPVVVDKTAGTLQVALSKSLILDGNSVPARAGDLLEDFFAATVDQYQWGHAGDRVPDDGTGPAFLLRLGQSGGADLQLSSPSRLRFSNGGSTSFLFPIDVENRADEPLTVSLASENVPAGWEIDVPPTVPLETRSVRRVPVIAAVPFQHEHGFTEEFVIAAQPVEDPLLRANLTLGVAFPAIPQPAGHHDTMWLHSRPANFSNARDVVAISGYELWFNPLETDPDPEAQDTHVGYESQVEDGDQVDFVWNFPLKPALRMGLDFDPRRPGLLRTAVEAGLPEADSELAANLWYCAPTVRTGQEAGLHGCARGSWFRVAHGTTDIGALSPNAPRDVEVTIAVDPQYDLIDHVEGANLRLELRLSLPRGTGNADMRGVLLYADRSQFTLPLFEYHDPLEQAFEDAGPLQLIPQSSTLEKEANPGKTSAFMFRVRNDGAKPMHVELDVQGIRREWASWQSTGLELSAGDEAEARLAVSVPFEAVHGERAEIFAIARDVEDDGVVAVSRVRVTVNDAMEIKDEAEDVEAAANQPFLEMGTFAAVAVALIGYRRRRQGR